MSYTFQIHEGCEKQIEKKRIVFSLLAS